MESLTITYFYPGMYAEFDNDPDFKGETPGIKYLFDEDGKLDLKNPIEVMTDDDYAELNPTIVLLPNESMDSEFEPGENLRPLNIQNASVNSSQPGCNDLSPTNEILTIRMPDFQLNGNIRRWPKQNEMYLWISVDVLAPNSNGIPTIGVSTTNPLTRYPVSRKNARKIRWVPSGISFVVQNWKYESQDLHIVWGCTRTESTFTTEATVSVKDSQGTYSLKASKVTKNTVELIASTIHDKCALLNNNKYQIDQGNGIRSNAPVYNFNGVRTYFTFDNIITNK